jgi:predicted GH43/DUF377 family glycosyl hydrolase
LCLVRLRFAGYHVVLLTLYKCLRLLLSREDSKAPRKFKKKTTNYVFFSLKRMV